MTPEELRYTKDHEWVRVEKDALTIGITDHAQEELGDVVYVELPKPGEAFEAGVAFGTVESVKAVSELFMPVSGEVIGINEALDQAPESVNSDPYGAGWMIRVRPTQAKDIDTLLSSEAYDAHVSGRDSGE